MRRLKYFFDWQGAFVLGEKKLSISCTVSPDKFSKWVTTGQSTSNPFRLQADGAVLRFQRTARLRDLLGFPPLYEFLGRWEKGQAGVAISGSYRMIAILRMFILVWLNTMTLGILVLVVFFFEILLGCPISGCGLESNPSRLDDARLMLAIAGGTFLFGLAVIAVVRVLGLKDRSELGNELEGRFHRLGCEIVK